MEIEDNEVLVIKYKGFNIMQNDSGYFWTNGETYGYFDSIGEAKASIDRYNSQEY